jgi:hypothetical protein
MFDWMKQKSKVLTKNVASTKTLVLLQLKCWFCFSKIVGFIAAKMWVLLQQECCKNVGFIAAKLLVLLQQKCWFYCSKNVGFIATKMLVLLQQNCWFYFNRNIGFITAKVLVWV